MRIPEERPDLLLRPTRREPARWVVHHGLLAPVLAKHEWPCGAFPAGRPAKPLPGGRSVWQPVLIAHDSLAVDVLNRPHEHHLACGVQANETTLAIAIEFNPTVPMSAAKYDECMQKLDAAGAGMPQGRSHHEAFEGTLMPILAELDEPIVMPAHTIVQ